MRDRDDRTNPVKRIVVLHASAISANAASRDAADRLRRLQAARSKPLAAIRGSEKISASRLAALRAVYPV